MTTHQLWIERNEHYRDFSKYQRPNVVGYFSIDINRQFDPSSKNLRYLRRPGLQNYFDLNAGFDQYQLRYETHENEEKIDFILRWLIHRNYLRNLIEETENIFICYRGILTKIMKTPYEKIDNWIIIATKVKNMIFFCEFWTDKKKLEVKAGMSGMQKLNSYWGRKFEQYLLSSNPTKSPDCSQSVNEFEEFILMYGRQLNGHYVLFGAETDAFNSDFPVDIELHLNAVKSSSFVELKTSVRVPNLPDNYFEDFKLLRWWSQSYIVGIENIICGIRNKHGRIQKLQDVKVDDLPSRSKIWKPRVCMKILNDFLSFVKNIMMHESDLTQWKFSWEPKSNFIHAQRLEHGSQNKILPEWFIEECKTLNVIFE